MKFGFLNLALAVLLAAGCASADKPKEARTAPATPAEAAAMLKKKEAKEHPPVKIGPDVIVDKEVGLVWPILTQIDDWGAWMSKVTKVEPGAGLSPGAKIKYSWEEKAVESEVVSVKENEEFSFKACASSKKALVKWSLKSMGPKRTLISLRAEVPYGTASETMDKLGPEMSDWIMALQAAANKAKPKDDDEE